MTDERAPRKKSGAFLKAYLPWLGLAAVAWGVAGIYTPFHAALVAGAYPIACEVIALVAQVVLGIWGRPLPPAPEGTGS